MMGRFVHIAVVTCRGIAQAWQALAATAIFGLLVINTVYSAPEPPGFDDLWRWSTIVLAFGLCCWNVRSAYRAYHLGGFLSMVGFLHAWSFLAFSFPAFEMTYRYDSLQLRYWKTNTEDPLLLVTVMMLGVFQLLFFLALGREPHQSVNKMTASARAKRPNRWLAALFFLLVIPLAISRLEIMLDLGLRGVVETMITREPFNDRLDGEQSPILLLLGTFFPVYATPLLCLGAKHAVRHPSVRGGLLYLVALAVGSAGVFFTGGRGELVYVLLVALVFMYVQGYGEIGRYKLIVFPLLALPMLLLALVFFLVAQARHGVKNPLSTFAEGAYVGYDYSAGDVTQTLGLGRFDAALIILDNFSADTMLWGKSYAYAVIQGINETLLPRILLGEFLPRWRISDQVMGYWIFGEAKASALPSMPGELFLNLGFVGVALGALVLGLASRLFFSWIMGFDGSVEFAWIMLVWTIARFISDESYLMAGYVARYTVPVLLLTLLVVRRSHSASDNRGTAAEREGVATGPQRLSDSRA